MKLIYIVEDDEDIRELTVYALEAAGFNCFSFEDGESFWKAFDMGNSHFDLILLDIMLPNEDGISILKKLRMFSEVPVIMLTAKGSEADKVKGLNFGADDYITKPFGVTELVARINAVLRRSKTDASENIHIYKNITLDNERHIVSVNEETIILTFLEFELLNYLLLNSNIVLSRNKMMSAVWGYNYEADSRTVDMHIKSLRKKLGNAGKHIKTIRNVGYKIGD